MSARRKAASLGAVGAASALLVTFTPGQASAHGTMFNPVSRVATCYAEGPENPKTQVCKDLVAASGTQPLYDWNEVNIANANGQHQKIIPDGKLCSANREKYKALDWARTDWPATKVSAGAINFRYRVTAAHPGTMTVYVTKEGYDPTKPLKWSDLETTPVTKATVARSAPSGWYEFSGNLPSRTGRHLLYKVWQRNDSTEAFYSCSDVVFGQSAQGAVAKAPSQQEIDAGASKSTVTHHGHGGDVPGERDAAMKAAANDGVVSLNAQNAAASNGSSTLSQSLAGAAAVGMTAGCFILFRRRRAS
ncbi:lytic polysaccharide monooxygenase auxiliary activity family 9 protein [Streptomyces zagrosensis]|uniref:Chitin-binding protein n=1 Tax=Streptomyces zagrosensis TaxID=1042984 RepID=A0A7W9UZH1_9ACTN|nr:lytic polysaccharide monooxygenase [Streptomyces zagrosensis]MBB5937008.1 chitin-binding protein [Streptomyces zagrosensis]